jgi:hypothetical protein
MVDARRNAKILTKDLQTPVTKYSIVYIFFV